MKDKTTFSRRGSGVSLGIEGVRRCCEGLSEDRAQGYS